MRYPGTSSRSRAIPHRLRSCGLRDFYSVSDGVQFTLQWRNEEEYLLGKAFLKELLGDEGEPSLHEPGRAPYYLLQNEQQYKALFDFRRELREKSRA